MNKRLIELIQMLNMRQNEFAKEIDVTPGNLNDWIKRNKKPGSDALLRIHEKFNVNINWLLTGYGDVFIKNDKKYIPKYPEEKRENFGNKFMWILYNMIIKLSNEQKQKLIRIISACFDQEIVYCAEDEKEEEKSA